MTSSQNQNPESGLQGHITTEKVAELHNRLGHEAQTLAAYLVAQQEAGVFDPTVKPTPAELGHYALGLLEGIRRGMIGTATLTQKSVPDDISSLK